MKVETTSWRNKWMPRCVLSASSSFSFTWRCLSSDEWKWEIQKKINNHYLLLIVAESTAAVLVFLRPKHRLRRALPSSSDRVSSFRCDDRSSLFYFSSSLSSRSNRLFKGLLIIKIDWLGREEEEEEREREKAEVNGRSVDVVRKINADQWKICKDKDHRKWNGEDDGIGSGATRSSHWKIDRNVDDVNIHM